MHKCHFGATELDFLGRSFTPIGINPRKKCSELSRKEQIPQVEKGFTTLFGILEILQNLYPKTL